MRGAAAGGSRVRGFLTTARCSALISEELHDAQECHPSVTELFILFYARTVAAIGIEIKNNNKISDNVNLAEYRFLFFKVLMRGGPHFRCLYTRCGAVANVASTPQISNFLC